MKVLGFAGWSGSGKTTLIERIIPRLVVEGLTVSLIKHAHHQFEIDTPGKDSYRHRHAGCSEVLVTSDMRWALMHEMRGGPEPTLDQQIERMKPVDLLLIEGWKSHSMPKIEVYRAANAKPLLHPEDERIIAVASDTAITTALPQFGIDDYDAITRFVMKATGLR